MPRKKETTAQSNSSAEELARQLHSVATDATTAPEVPHEIAQQYGISHRVASKTSAPAPSPADTVDAEDSSIDNPETDALVDQIVSQESDELLALHDGEKIAQDGGPRHGFGARLGRAFKHFWHNKPARWTVICLLLIALSAAAVIPRARYALLNIAGVRSSASIQVLDDTTKLPLKNVTVTLGSHKSHTNREGKAVFSDLKLGEYRLSVKRLAFAPVQQQVTIGWGSNPLGSVQLKAVGNQYSLVITDFLSGKPIAGAEAESEALNALSDKDGKVLLTIDDVETTELPVRVNANGYRPETATLTADGPMPLKIALVPAQKTVFVSKQSGTYDVYMADLDGKNRRLLLAGSGHEDSAISLVVHPDNTRAALVSVRNMTRDKDGYSLRTLTLIDLQTGVAVAVDNAQQIQLVDWLGDRLIYRTTVAGGSAAQGQRNRLLSYNPESNARTQLAAANQFNVVTSIGGFLYYAPSSTDPDAALGLFKIKPDGSGRERLSSEEVWTALRPTYDSLALQTPASWYAYSLTSRQMSKTTMPTALTSYAFAEDPDQQRIAWTENRDGKGLLFVRPHDKAQGQRTLVNQPGITYPVRWAGGKAIIYRVATSMETADYAVSPDGGEAHKISDVTPTYGYGELF